MQKNVDYTTYIDKIYGDFKIVNYLGQKKFRCGTKQPVF